MLSMDLLRYSTSRVSTFLTHDSHLRRPFSVRSALTLPFKKENANYYDELQAAIHVVHKASHLCLHVKKSLLSSDGQIIQKTDRSPVTIADFGVQALVSLELSHLFPSIPLVAEEDSAFVRSNNLVDAVADVVNDKLQCGDKLANDDILKAIDRGGKEAYLFSHKPDTYWVLDPIDGTRGFVKGKDALYVVGLALVVKGKIVLGVMGCPNWQEDSHDKSESEGTEGDKDASGAGLVMISHVACGTWKIPMWDNLCTSAISSNDWIRCFVDVCQLVHEGRFCFPESQKWESLPLSTRYSASVDRTSAGDKEVLLLPTCCGSLCRYMMVATGRASVFILHTRAEKTIKAWDHAVGVICIHEAGGKVTDWRGSQLDFAADQTERKVIFPSGGILVTNGRLHGQILGLISASVV